MTTKRDSMRAALEAAAAGADAAPAPTRDAAELPTPPAREKRPAGAGRPPVDPRKKRSGQRVSVYVTEAEHAAIEAAAARAGLSASAWARAALLRATRGE